MRRWAIGLVLAAGLASLTSIPPAGASGFHCPGTPGSASESFMYMVKDGSKGPGWSSPTKAFHYFLRTGSKGKHFPLTTWTHPSKNLFVYDGIHGKIQVTTFRTQRGSYLVGHVDQTCSTI